MRIISSEEIVSSTAQSLGAPEDAKPLDLLKPALRRGVFLLAPCSAADLLRFVAEPFGPLGDLREEVEEALTELITFGDVLEIKRIGSDPWGTPAITLRPAPPSFVMRGKHEAIILGVAGEHPSPLTGELAAQVATEGPVRVLRADIDRLDVHLRLLGLAQLSEHVWLRTPAAENARAFLDGWTQRLDSQSTTVGPIGSLEILDPAKSQLYYRARWRTPVAKDNGIFVARRGQAYGGKVWSIVKIDAGAATKLLDLPHDEWQRPCDVAWRLQAAVDAIAGKPQSFDVTELGAVTRFAFGSPIPSFAERRLALAGVKTAVPGSLFAFDVTSRRKEDEAALLRDLLWMKQVKLGQNDNDNP